MTDINYNFLQKQFNLMPPTPFMFILRGPIMLQWGFYVRLENHWQHNLSQRNHQKAIVSIWSDWTRDSHAVTCKEIKRKRATKILKSNQLKWLPVEIQLSWRQFGSSSQKIKNCCGLVIDKMKQHGMRWLKGGSAVNVWDICGSYVRPGPVGIPCLQAITIVITRTCHTALVSNNLCPGTY